MDFEPKFKMLYLFTKFIQINHSCLILMNSVLMPSVKNMLKHHLSYAPHLSHRNINNGFWQKICKLCSTVYIFNWHQFVNFYMIIVKYSFLNIIYIFLRKITQCCVLSRRCHDLKTSLLFSTRKLLIVISTSYVYMRKPACLKSKFY